MMAAGYMRPPMPYALVLGNLREYRSYSAVENFCVSVNTLRNASEKKLPNLVK